MLGNFQALNNEFSINHEPLTTVTSQAGYHTKIFFPSGTTDPNLTAPENSIYPKVVSGLVQAFFQNGNAASNVIQITGAGLGLVSAANTGTAGGIIYTMDLPTGNRLYFGSSGGVPSTGSVTVIFTPIANFTTILFWGAFSNDINGRGVSCRGTVSQLNMVATDAIASANWLALGVV